MWKGRGIVWEKLEGKIKNEGQNIIAHTLYGRDKQSPFGHEIRFSGTNYKIK